MDFLLSNNNMSKLESWTLSLYTFLDIVDFEDTVSAGEITISCVGQKCIFRKKFDTV